MSIPPDHLAKFDLKENNSFDQKEKLYRRFPNASFKPFKELFSELQWKDLQQGLSVNRSAYSNPEDVLWSFISENEITKSCTYIEKQGDIGVTECIHFPCTDPKTQIQLKIIHSPENCNVAHVEITLTQLTGSEPRTFKNDVKAYIASLFSKLLIDSKSIEQ